MMAEYTRVENGYLVVIDLIKTPIMHHVMDTKDLHSWSLLPNGTNCPIIYRYE